MLTAGPGDRAALPLPTHSTAATARDIAAYLASGRMNIGPDMPEVHDAS